MRIILASASPRRPQLLKEIIPDFRVIVTDIDEEALVDPDPVVTARKTAAAKANAAYLQDVDAIVIGGDTVVTIDGEQLAKPKDKADAYRMLRRLSGRTHTVITAICICWPCSPTDDQFQVQTQVTFRDLTDEEIWAYIATGEPMDKAGAYGAQGEAAKMIAKIDGSLTNVIGLPVDELRAALAPILSSGNRDRIGHEA